MNNNREKLINQINSARENVVFTYAAHWNIVNRLNRRWSRIKIIQIILSAASTCGFITVFIDWLPNLSWFGALTSSIALALNLYTLNFDLLNEKERHKHAADDLWEIREEYDSLLTDADSMSDAEIQEKRNVITKRVSAVNKEYPGTDKQSYAKAKKERREYM